MHHFAGVTGFIEMFEKVAVATTSPGVDVRKARREKRVQLEVGIWRRASDEIGQEHCLTECLCVLRVMSFKQMLKRKISMQNSYRNLSIHLLIEELVLFKAARGRKARFCVAVQELFQHILSIKCPKV